MDDITKKRSRNLKSKIKKQFLLHGYPSVRLCKGGEAYNVKVHRLVAEAFIDNIDNLPMVNHLDNNKLNNWVSNLEWTDSKGNSDHKVKQNRQARNTGEKAGGVKLTEVQVKEIRALCDEGILSQSEIAGLYGIRQTQVSRIKNNLRWINTGIKASEKGECQSCQ